MVHLPLCDMFSDFMLARNSIAPFEDAAPAPPPLYLSIPKFLIFEPSQDSLARLDFL
jgi:hypothetical protein